MYSSAVIMDCTPFLPAGIYCHRKIMTIPAMKQYQPRALKSVPEKFYKQFLS
jgi:hypothetical protein